VPIYRQIADQIRFQIAAGTLKTGRKLPSVRELADQLTVNQNTILKVYNQLCQEKVLHVDRGNGTFVTEPSQSIPTAERKQIVSRILSDAAVQAAHLGIDLDKLHDLLEKEYQKISQQRLRSTQNE
jgi:GntR family transcriptional regulator